MGAILDVTEMLKEPAGMAVAAVVIAGGCEFLLTGFFMSAE
jgi:hypothetical protein